MNNTYTITEEESKRLDILKFISIFFVLFIHIYSTTMNFSNVHGEIAMPKWLVIYETFVSDIISRVAVPAFVMLSGVLAFAKKKPYFEMLRNKIRTLLIPYLFWNLFWIGVWIVLQSIPAASVYFSGNSEKILSSDFIGWIKMFGLFNEFPFDYPLWVMRDLMVAFICFPLIAFVIEKYPKIVLTAALIYTISPVTLPFKAIMCWFVIGGCLVTLGIHITDVDRLDLRLIAGVYAICIILVYFTDHSSLRSIMAIVGIIFYSRITSYIYNNDNAKDCFLWLSKWTFIIYVFHELTLSSVKKVGLKILPINSISLFLQYNLTPILIILICIAVGLVINKISPKFYLLITGGRGK